MKTILLIICFLALNLSVSAGEEKLQIFKNQETEESMRYLVGVNETDSDSGGWVVIFGRVNGKLVKRSFHLNGMSFYTYEGHEGHGQDEQWNFTLISKDEDNIQLKLTSRLDRKSKTLKYKRYNSGPALNFAKNVISQVRREHQELRELDRARNISEFKQLLELAVWDHGFLPSEDKDFPFPTYQLQIEFNLTNTLSDDLMAKTSIVRNGKDPISKMFRQGSKWHKNSALASTMVEDELQDMLNGVSEEDDPQTQSAFSKVANNLKSTALKNSAKDFVRYEITNASGFVCEDFTVVWESTTWVLTDGSTYTYAPTSECD